MGIGQPIPVCSMINWLLQSLEEHSGIAAAHPPDGFLSRAEIVHFATLRTHKRRSEWLLGRWTAKQLIRSAVPGGAGVVNHAISIERGEDGAPVVVAPALPPLTVSISHAHGFAMCAVALGEGVLLGVDIELIAPRSTAFVLDYFTDEERASIEALPFVARSTAVNAIWSAKEATLKALHLGLKVDTRRVGCPVRIENLDVNDVWSDFQITCDWQNLPCSPVDLQGWIRLKGDYVLTLVAPA